METIVTIGLTFLGTPAAIFFGVIVLPTVAFTLNLIIFKGK